MLSGRDLVIRESSCRSDPRRRVARIGEYGLAVLLALAVDGLEVRDAAGYSLAPHLQQPRHLRPALALPQPAAAPA